MIEITVTQYKKHKEIDIINVTKDLQSKGFPRVKQISILELSKSKSNKKVKT